ncbi:RyR domain-containing protein [Ectothiorhodospira shaposhnikovii]|uniref:RyR domain-containing protein n=1 Tax=Ectothiorhodospira shaposhnikovii TaxID=1054 RepID=UPI001EE95847|nr:RyR domain-containing protein [Ectothiorhodospira shaposhnikovii]MCG5512845.1 hypothetical protein [Ectothiorhodospira shaposhnikovii]
MISVEDVAKVAHEVNRAYCLAATNDDTQKPWEETPQWLRESVIAGVRFHLTNPQAGPEASHENWLEYKRAEGWRYGHRKDEAKKLHPCMIPFVDLPRSQQTKDHLFRAVVHALMDKINEKPVEARN